MKVELYGLPTCSRCKTAKMMLEKRNIPYLYFPADSNSYRKLPILIIDGVTYSAKESLMKIREL